MNVTPFSSSSSRTPRLAAASAVALTAFSFLSQAQANLVLNGGFEAGPTVTIPTSGGTTVGGLDTDWIDGSLANWSVSGTQFINVRATNQNIYFASQANGDTGFALGGPRSGDLAAVFPNTPNYDGGISQMVPTVLAGIYRVSFYLANQIGDANNNLMVATWGGAWLGGNGGNGGNASLPGAIPVADGWKYYEFLVSTATPDTELAFVGGNTSAANLLDDVSVEFVAVPEISSFGAVMGFGLLAMGSMVRLRRRSLATA